MRRARIDVMIEKFEMYNPGLLMDIIEYEQIDKNRLLITMNDGIKYIYHYILNSYRKVIDYDYSEIGCKNRISTRLVELMADRGIDRKTLSQKTGISEVSIGCYINKKKIPTLYTATLLARALNCDVTDLMD